MASSITGLIMLLIEKGIVTDDEVKRSSLYARSILNECIREASQGESEGP